MPIIFAALVVSAVVASPPSQSLGNPEPTGDVGATETPIPLSAPPHLATTAPGGLPDGLTGRLTIKRGGELITLQAPEMHEVDRRPDDMSKEADFVRAPSGELVAYTVFLFEGEEITGSRLFVTDLVSHPRLVYQQSGAGTIPFTWLASGDLLVAVNTRGAASLRRIGVDGVALDLATTSASVSYFYPSPDATRIAFSQNGPGGWRITTFDAETGLVRDLGAMGSDAPGVPPFVPPEQKGPMYVAWSRDGSKLAFGGGHTAPYFMTIVDVSSGTSTRTEFPFGYPGEIKWSRDGATLAVSTYDPDRTRHEVYVVDPKTGASRHLIAGCVIVWSPDGRFLALHAEKADGTAIIDVATGEYGSVGMTGDVPVAWE